MSHEPAAITGTGRGLLLFRLIEMVEIHGCGRRCRDDSLSRGIQGHSPRYRQLDQFAAGKRYGRSFINDKSFLRQVCYRWIVEAERQYFVGCAFRNGDGPSLRRPLFRSLERPAKKRTQIATGTPVVAPAVSPSRRAAIPATATIVVIAAAIVIIVCARCGNTGSNACRLQQRQRGL